MERSEGAHLRGVGRKVGEPLVLVRPCRGAEAKVSRQIMLVYMLADA